MSRAFGCNRAKAFYLFNTLIVSGNMCLAIPGKVIRLKNSGKIAVIDYGGKGREAANIIKARVGDTVLVQHKAVVEKVDGGSAVRA